MVGFTRGVIRAYQRAKELPAMAHSWHREGVLVKFVLVLLSLSVVLLRTGVIYQCKVVGRPSHDSRGLH